MLTHALTGRQREGAPTPARAEAADAMCEQGFLFFHTSPYAAIRGTILRVKLPALSNREAAVTMVPSLLTPEFGPRRGEAAK